MLSAMFTINASDTYSLIVRAIFKNKRQLKIQSFLNSQNIGLMLFNHFYSSWLSEFPRINTILCRTVPHIIRNNSKL
jgi:hypothetical protein